MVQFTGLAANGANNTDGEGAKRWRRAVTADGADAGTALLPTADRTLVCNVHVCTLHTCTLHTCTLHTDHIAQHTGTVHSTGAEITLLTVHCSDYCYAQLTVHIAHWSTLCTT